MKNIMGMTMLFILMLAVIYLPIYLFLFIAWFVVYLKIQWLVAPTVCLFITYYCITIFRAIRGNEKCQYNAIIISYFIGICFIYLILFMMLAIISSSTIPMNEMW